MKIKYIFISAVLILLTASCSDFLNVKDEAAINPAVWDNENSAKLYINNIYNSCLPAFGGESPVSDGSLNAISDETSGMDSKLLLGTLENGSVGVYSAATYQSIRYINIAFNEMKASTLTGDARNKILGQLYFFRAWQHWKLIQLYGGVPYMRDVVDYLSPDSIKNTPRYKTSVCISYLKQDLEKAIEYLPASWPTDEYGRITRAGAASFLGRVLLFYASPQFNPTNDINRWKDAYDSNLRAKTMCLQDGYGLMDVSSAPTTQFPYTKDFNKIFITKKTAGNNEVIIVTPYLQAYKFHGYENSVRPVEITNGTGRPSNCPTWDLVIAFPMKDGRPAFNASRQFTGNTDINKYYRDRDPRFYATVAFNGCYYPLEGNAVRRQWTYSGGEGTTTDKTSPTGFYCRKYVNPSINGEERSKTYTDWIELRYAEVLLNLAESAFEYQGANSETGYDCLKQIRQRAGIDAGTDGYYGLKANANFTPVELVMNERRVELAFEGKRFFDLRRRNMFTTNLGNNIVKLNGWKKSGSGYTFTLKTALTTEFNSLKDNLPVDSVYKYFTMAAKSTGPLVKAIDYKATTDPAALKNVFSGSYNFFDIPQAILSRSPALVQTIGWENGTFNPFE